MKRVFVIFIALLGLLRMAAATDGFQSRQYGAADGLPNHTVRHMMQDSHGFIWIATLNGLTRYDGTHFTTFRSEPDNPLSLSDNRVYYITEDNDNFLWIETTGRIYSCFDLRKGSFAAYTEGNPDPYNKVFLAKNGDIWLSNTDGGALRVRHNADRTLTSKKFDATSGLLPADKVGAVFETQGADILLGTSGGFSRVSGDNVKTAKSTEAIAAFFEAKGHTYAVTKKGKTLRIEDMKTIPVGQLPEGETVISMIPGDEDITIFTDRGTWLTDLKSGQSLPHPELAIKNGNTTTDNKGRPWIYNHTGHLTHYSRKDGKYRTFTLIPEETMGRTDHERYRVTEDGEGTIWISTYGNGLFAYREEDGSLRHFQAGKEGLIGSNSLRGMLLDSTGTIWLGTGQSGISTIWRDTRDTRHFLPDPTSTLDASNSIRTLSPAGGEHILFSTKDGKVYDWLPGDSTATLAGKYPANIYATLADGKGTAIYGTRGNGLYVGERHFRHAPGDRTSLPDDNIYFIHRDRKGRIWTGTFGGGLSLMTPDADKGATFRSFFSDTHGRNEQRHLIEDLDGRFWIGTSEGLLTFHPDSLLNDPKRFKAYSKNNSELECNEVRHLMRDSKGELWLATGNDGVIRAATSNDGGLKVLKHYTAADGLSNNSVQAIAEDDKGNIWIATQYGLSMLTPTKETIENFIFSDGPQENTYAEGSVLKLKDGTLLFGTSRGVANIDPEKYTSSDISKAPLRFTRLTVNGAIQTPGGEDSPLTETPDYTERITLKPHQNSITVDFTVADFRDRGRFRYSYILEGHDKEWSSPSAEGTATFSYLPSGRYTLRVRCLDGGRVVAEGELGIEVRTPWWRSWWSIGIYAIIFIGGFWIIRRLIAARTDARAVRPYLEDDNASAEHIEGVTSDALGRTRSVLTTLVDPVHSRDEVTTFSDTADARAVRPYQEDASASEFMGKVEAVARENMRNGQFSVDDFAAALGLGRAVFYRRIKETAGITPNEYLKKMRLAEAARLLREAPELNMAEIADRVGFSDSLYFSKCFKSEFGLSPTAYRKE